MQSNLRWPAYVSAAVVLVWLVIVLIGYYWVHKPIDIPLIQSLGGMALDLLTVGLIAAPAGGLGRRILALSRRIGIDHTLLSRAERLALEGAFGFGVIAWGALALGLIGLFNGIALWGALLVVTILTRRGILGWLADWRSLIREAVHPRSGWIGLLTLVLVLLLAAALLSALAPPYAWDSLAYHLVGPQRYLAVGRITAQPDNHFLGFPQSLELLYGIALSLFGRDTAAAPLHWLFGLFMLMTVGGLVRRFADDAAAWLAMVLLMSAFSLWLLAGEPYVDLAVMAYGALTGALATGWVTTRRTGWLILMGACIGLGLGVKYTAGALLPALMFFVAWREPSRMLRNGLILAGVSALCFVPWMAKGLLLYSNPTYPYFFGGLNWDAVRTANFSAAGQGLIQSGQGWQLAVLPFAATVFGDEHGVGFSFTAGPWLLTTWFLLIPGWRWLDERARQLARDGLLLSIPLLAFWILMAAWSGIGAQTRLMAAAVPLAAVTGGLGFYGLSGWPRKPVDLYLVLRAMLVITLLLEGIDVMRQVTRAGSLPYLLSMTSRDDFLNNNLGTHMIAMRRLGELPAHSTVRLMWEPRSYYCPPTITCIPDSLLDHWARPIKLGQTPDDIFKNWQREGDNYLLVFEAGYKFYAAEPDMGLFPAALERWTLPIWSDGISYTLYAWRQP